MLYDHIPDDNRNLLRIVDHFSKIDRVVSIPSKKSQTVLDAIKLWFALQGKIDSLQSDNGTKFFNWNLKTYLEKRRSKSYSRLSFSLMESRCYGDI